MRPFYIIILLLSLVAACEPPKEKIDEGDTKLAEVGTRVLYLSELEGMITDDMDDADSTLFVNAYVERWARDEVLLLEAEQNLPNDLDINALVEDYRSSLLRLNYENLILETRLDSAISDQELQAFYESNKDQYQLEKPILRCLFMKVPTPVPSERAIQRLWNQADFEDIIELRDFAVKYAESFLLNDSTWYNLEDITELIPVDIVNSKNINRNTDWTLNAKNFKYYLKVREMKSKKDIAPLSYIQEQAARAILHRRKMKILADWRMSLFEQAGRENKVKIYSK